MRSPDPNMQNRSGNNAYQQNGKREFSPNQSMASMLTSSAPAGYYGPGQDLSQQPHPYPAHPAHMTNNQFNNYAPQQYSGYGQVNYPASTGIQDLQSMDTRKRAIEALNDFLGDIKRRAIDPSSYYDVGQRLQSQNLPLPISTGFGYSTGNNYNSGNNNNSYGNASSLMDSFGASSGGILGGGSGGGGALAHGPLSQSYSLPLPNARTKNDLQEIDRFLEQLQATVYENSSSAAAAGVQQPGLHSQHTQYPGFNNHYRNSDSPPNMHYGSSSSAGGVHSLTSVPNMSGMTASASALDTPALTPASVTSYASSSHSPMSTHSRSSMSSANGSNMYPSLPSVTAVSDMSSGYPSTTSAPPSGLGSAFDGFEARRYSGGRLQREAPAPKSDRGSEDAMDMDDGSKTPRNAKEVEDRPGSSSLDPALRSTPTPQQSAIQSPNPSSGEGDKAQEVWVENIRVIEALRQYVRERLERQEFENMAEHDEHAHQDAHEHEHMQHDHLQQHDHELKQDNDIAYPVLKAEA